MYAKRKSEGLELILVSIDEPQDRPRGQKYLASKKYPVECYFLDEAGAMAIESEWKFSSLPAVVVFDAAGKLVQTFTEKPFQAADVEKFVEPMLKK
jgi:hypothetical protein